MLHRYSSTLLAFLLMCCCQLSIGQIADPTSGTSNSALSDKVETVYPIPAKNHLFIPVELSSNATVTVKVFDILGSEVATLIKEPHTKGQQKLKADLTELDDGHYFLTLEANGKLLSTQKFVILKS
ncbi:MAG: T9SS type A sorting domain-containing protein [Salibacteraceae bacterium]